MFRRLFRRFSAPQPFARPAPRRPLTLERLEDRCVPAVSGTVSSGVLTVNGDSGDNTIVINEMPTVGEYLVTDGLLPLSGSPFVGVQSIVVNTRTGLDTVTF